MSIVVRIKQDTQSIKKIDLSYLREWVETKNLAFGILNIGYALEEYNGEQDIKEIRFVIYQPQMIGRGVGFYLDQNYNVELDVNYFNSEGDIRLFYDLIQLICDFFGVDYFYQEEEKRLLKEISMLQEETLRQNKKLMKSDLEKGITVFGAVYPIVLESDFLEKIKSLNEEEAVEQFGQYLNEKQQHDYYFAKAILVEDKNTKEISGYYVLTEGVESIFPRTPYIPFGYHLEKSQKVQDWSIRFVELSDSGFQMIGSIPFHQINQLFSLEKCKTFDQNHVLVTLSKEHIKKISELSDKKIKESQSFDYIHNRKEIFPYSSKMLWNLITDPENSSWRSDVSSVGMIDHNQFIECDKKNNAIVFTVIKKNPFKLYEMRFQGKELNGVLQIIFSELNDSTTILELIGKINWQTKLKKVFGPSRLKKKQNTYINDLYKKLKS